MRDLRDAAALILLSGYGQKNRRRTAVTEETATSGRPVTVDRVINWELSVKHRAVARDALRVQEGGRKEHKSSRMGQFCSKSATL
jgi:hypothetical protein